ncbi:MAG: hypothetical protein EAZ55_12010 [Cytophagales bacterium]|nr:MAG: hypothetical protein EAZ55_12010 [Cytophagales bacterium]
MKMTQMTHSFRFFLVSALVVLLALSQKTYAQTTVNDSKITNYEFVLDYTGKAILLFNLSVNIEKDTKKIVILQSADQMQWTPIAELSTAQLPNNSEVNIPLTISIIEQTQLLNTMPQKLYFAMALGSETQLKTQHSIVLLKDEVEKVLISSRLY